MIGDPWPWNGNRYWGGCPYCQPRCPCCGRLLSGQPYAYPGVFWGNVAMGSGIADSNQAAAGSQGGNLCQCSPDKQTGGSQGDLGR